MHSQSLFSILDKNLQPKKAGGRDPALQYTEFSIEAEPAVSFLKAHVFGQLCTGCGGPAELGTLMIAADPAMLWRHVQGGIGKVVHCTRGGGLKVQAGPDPACTFMELRRHALYAMASHLTVVGDYS